MELLHWLVGWLVGNHFMYESNNCAAKCYSGDWWEQNACDHGLYVDGLNCLMFQ